MFPKSKKHHHFEKTDMTEAAWHSKSFYLNFFCWKIYMVYLNDTFDTRQARQNFKTVSAIFPDVICRYLYFKSLSCLLNAIA